MTFIGRTGVSAPRLYDLKVANFEELSEQVLRLIRKLVHEAKLIHGDLSAHNILVWEREPYLIDLSQAVLTTHLNGPRLLARDIANILNFFSQKNVDVDEYASLLQDSRPEVEQPRDGSIDAYGYRRPKKW